MSRFNLPLSSPSYWYSNSLTRNGSYLRPRFCRRQQSGKASSKPQVFLGSTASSMPETVSYCPVRCHIFLPVASRFLPFSLQPDTEAASTHFCKHIQCSTSTLSRLQGTEQGTFIHNSPSSTVHYSHALLALGKSAVIQQAWKEEEILPTVMVPEPLLALVPSRGFFVLDRCLVLTCLPRCSEITDPVQDVG